MPAFPCDPAIQPSALPAASGTRAVELGLFPTPLRKRATRSVGSSPELCRDLKLHAAPRACAGRASSSQRAERPSLVSIEPAVTTATSTLWQTRAARAARQLVKPKINAAPGLMCEPVMSVLRRFVILRTASPGPRANHAAFPE